MYKVGDIVKFGLFCANNQFTLYEGEIVAVNTDDIIKHPEELSYDIKVAINKESDKELFKHISSSWVSTNITDIQIHLGQLRDKSTDEAQMYQKAIDDLELKKYNCDNYIGKYFVFQNNKYIFIKQVLRKYSGPEFTCAYVSNFENDVSLYTDYHLHISWDQLYNLKESTKEAFIEHYSQYLDKFIHNYSKN